jgi:hypothetical protein
MTNVNVDFVGALGTGDSLTTALADWHLAEQERPNVAIATSSVCSAPKAFLVSGGYVAHTPLRDGSVNIMPTDDMEALATASCVHDGKLHGAVCETCHTVSVSSAAALLHTCTTCGSSKMNTDGGEPQEVDLVQFSDDPADVLVAISSANDAPAQRSGASSRTVIPDLDDLLKLDSQSGAQGEMCDDDDDEEHDDELSMSGARDVTGSRKMLLQAMTTVLKAAGAKVKHTDSLSRWLRAVESAALKIGKAELTHDDLLNLRQKRFPVQLDAKPKGKARDITFMVETVFSARTEYNKFTEKLVTMYKQYAGRYGYFYTVLGMVARMLDDALWTATGPKNFDGRKWPTLRNAIGAYLHALETHAGETMSTSSAVPVGTIDLTDALADSGFNIGDELPPEVEDELAEAGINGYDPDYDPEYEPDGDTDDETLLGAGRDFTGSVTEADDPMPEVFEMPSVSAPAGMESADDDTVPVNMLASVVSAGTPGSSSFDFVSTSSANGQRRWLACYNGVTVAVAERANVPTALANVFDEPTFGISIANVVQRSTDVQQTLLQNGFAPLQVAVKISPFVKQYVEDAANQALSVASAQNNEQIESIVGSLSVAMLGVEKQYFPDVHSPLRQAICASAAAHGISSSKVNAVLDTAFQSGAVVEHVGAVMSLAQRLAAMVPEVREGMCHAIASAPYSLTASREVAAHNATAMSVAAAQPMLPVTAPGVGMGMSVSTATAPVPAVFGGNKPSGGLTMFRSIAGM